jgi:TatD DNase family protein
MIDTHCHLTDPRIGDQLEAILSRAAAAGVSRMVTIGTGIADSRDSIVLCVNRNPLRCTVGVHPSYVMEEDFNDLPHLREMLDSPAVVGIGEIGLDYSRGRQNRDRQIEFFKWQLNLATETDRPVVIHCREAIDDCLAIVKDFPKLAMDFHCFTGTTDEARRILDAGYLIGFTGVVTFTTTESLRDNVRLTPIDRMVVETDAPYLSPEPMRKVKICEPAFVMHTAAMVAQIKGVSVAELDRITSATAAAFYRWPE